MRVWLPAVLACAVLAGCSESGDETESAKGGSADPLRSELDDAFRVDLASVDVTYDFFPERDRVDGRAELSFSMRPGQERPIFHFNPLRGEKADERAMLSSIVLDGEALDPASDEDLRVVRTAPDSERAYELQRKLDEGTEHSLEIAWSMPKPYPPKPARPWFFQTFDDTQGPGDEIDSPFPTINSPEELATHSIDLRVHAREPYSALGSGEVEEVDSGEAAVQEWAIDTADTQISSSTMFFAAVPSAAVTTSSIDADGVRIDIVSNRPAKDVAKAEDVARKAVSDLVADFGPFPVDRVEVLLTRWGSGMEYFGGFRTGLGALRHEMGHMYFGTTLVNRTWRDTWWDEAAVQWWQGQDRLRPVASDYEGTFGDDRPPAAPGFDTSAYGAGAKVFESVARELGGDERMRELLGEMSAEQRFEPFSTEDFIDRVVDFDGSVDRAELERWMLSPPRR